MKSIRRNILNSWFSKAGAAYIVAAVIFAGVPMSAFAAPLADIKINGNDGTTTITEGETWSFSWTSNDATVCQMNTPSGTSGVTLAGNDGPLGSDHPWYPAVGSSTTLTINCTDGTDTTTDSATVKVVAASTGGNGGGSSSDVDADIKINGNDGTTTITNGDTWNFSWTSEDATACQITSPSGVSGITLAGNDGPIASDHPWYPTVGNSTTLTIDCTDGTTTATDSATVRIISGNGGGSSSDVDADIKINGNDGTTTITNGDTWNFSWTSEDATACQITSPSGTTGVTLAGNDGPIASDHPWYPSIGSSTTLTIDCTDGVDTATDSATVRVVAATHGGGGSSGGGGHNHGGGSSNNPTVVTAPAFCPYITQYMRMGQVNDTLQVIRLQAFLKNFEGYDYVTLTGVFDAATQQAVNSFQQRYSSEILAPWGISYSTGYVYLTTSKKINEIICGPQAPVVIPTYTHTPAPAPDCPLDTATPVGDKVGANYSKEGGFGSSSASVPVVGTVDNLNPDVGIDFDKGHSIKDNLTASIFNGPSDLGELMQCIWMFVLILVVLYILASVLENVLYSDTVENIKKKFFTKWITISVGLVVAIIVAYIFAEWCLILPLFITLVASLVWMFFYPKHDSIKDRAVTWQTTVSEKTKKLLEETKESIEDDQKNS